MDDRRAGLALRALRRRRRLRQVDLAALAGLSQQAISLIERGHLDRLALRTVRRAFGAVDAGFGGIVRWRGGELDRLLDARHADLVGRTLGLLASGGWDPRAEVSYSVFGERGSIDVLAASPAVRTIPVVVVKSELISVEGTLRKIDEKVRLVRHGIGAETFGWPPTAVGCLLVLPEASTARRRLERHAPVLASALPARGWVVRRWLTTPEGELRGLVFLPPTNPGGARRVRREVPSPPVRHEPAARA